MEDQEGPGQALLHDPSSDQGAAWDKSLSDRGSLRLNSVLSFIKKDKGKQVKSITSLCENQMKFIFI